ncbi:hypothetical protein [Idiomarina sp.]|nr:hypothetical protein [Idiomarina sp.]
MSKTTLNHIPKIEAWFTVVFGSLRMELALQPLVVLSPVAVRTAG